MSDDFGTVNVKRGDRAREIEVMRQRYRTHRESLSRLAADAPTEALADEYQRLISGIDISMRKLDELEGRSTDFAETQKMSTSAGMRPLAGTTPPPPAPGAPTVTGTYIEPPAANPNTRMALIIVGAVVVLGIIGYLIWHASSDRRAKNRVVTDTTSTTVTTAAGTEPPITPAPTTASTETAAASGGGALKVTPAVADYGVVRKGTRAVRQFAITNGGAAPIEIQVARSACRCLYYEYNAKLTPNKKETITVTVDGAKAKAGALDEQIAVTAKNDPSVTATLEVRATIK